MALAACGEDVTAFPDATPRRDTGQANRDATTGVNRDANSAMTPDAAPGSDDAAATANDDAATAVNADAAATANEDATTTAVDGGAPGSGSIQLIDISDWHAQIDPIAPATGSTIAIGGASTLSTYFRREELANPNTLIVAGGDSFGASPPLSAFHDEEPAVLALSMMGLDVDTLGNHNFDKSLTHLQRMIGLSQYTYVSSNLANIGSNLTNVAAPFYIATVGGVQVAFIGITNADAALLLPAGRLGTMTVSPPVAAAQAARANAQAAGAQVFVALVHMGATVGTSTATWQGPLIDFAAQVTGFHVIFGDHTDREVNYVVNGQRVMENGSKGRTYARVRLDVAAGGAVTVTSANLITPRTGVPIDGAIETAMAPFRTRVAAQLDQPMGIATREFPRANNIERVGETALGNLVTDAMRARYQTQVAFTNGGGLRAPVPSSYLPMNMALRRQSPGYAVGPPYDLVVGDAYTVLPFGNVVVTRNVTGAQLWASMENGVSAMPASNGRFAQVSGIRFTYTASAAPGSRVLSLTLNDGTPVVNGANTMYSAAVIDFINGGGDGYTALADGQGASRELAADVLAGYVTAQGTVTPTISGRIQRVFCGPRRAPVAGDLVINEIHGDPAGSLATDLAGDANGDGARNATDDEFVEIVNVSGATLDMTGVTLSDAMNVRHTFPASALSCGRAVVVFGGGTAGGPGWQPSWVVASTSNLSINNAGDTMSLGTMASPTSLATVTFGAEIANDTSLVRQPELSPSGALVEHLSVSTARFSPGTRANGSRF